MKKITYRLCPKCKGGKQKTMGKRCPKCKGKEVIPITQ
jgi:DnaJ-class molecular chaperone